ncbi:MAG: MBL fold metallo-hydrolase [Candidatus Zambryskibacteria bacterium]|nr:MBL fold metallo-hydrolase [Candidatus Zambryskibacteria bacterium]
MDFEDLKKEFHIWWRLWVLILLFLVTIGVFYTAFRIQNHPLKVAFLDIGQGDAIFIESPTGNQIIFDGGPGSALVSQVSKQISLFDRTIDMIVVTNPDRDHFEGFIPLLERYTVTTLLEPGVTADKNPLYQELKKSVQRKNITAHVARTGERILLGGGAYIEVLFPDRDVEDVSHNDGSLVARLVYGETGVMLTGDTTKNIEKYLVGKYPNSLDSDILKVAHHGSETSTSDEFVKAVSPDIAVISAGKGNSYGHPRQATLDTLIKNKVQTLVTMNEGTIVFESDGKRFKRKK